ncbi:MULTISPECIES: glycoside hydrolase family 127 protein [unclassified Cryobacterium]|uniref:glycoside hydrolase family 127 protein n=1 Tax=unclassified Cryobacterium TaxID=2649013 RepID=UPI002AB410CF|nr:MULTISPECIES: beta-L-arabinofuranosidase domain-containing protein [unclassified Cryobacterium]MDY7530002.1 glycoside hydrolase family 127 protein [Cryobacterium sp. 10C2]MDY7555349.1 glycoside hydrolase family 127 protein [Cryobacterium sp. 10C3]MEB0202638.1 glycoside hydrolase family 127 protein [Cryobacterium sp. 5I3]MEB0291096.1 glycoside hydrolase family 127 protein [Cryobacterium sp. 10C2]
MPGTSPAVITPSSTTGPLGAIAYGQLNPLPSTAVSLDADSFLGEWQARNHDASIRHCVENLESSGVLHNFRRVADGEAGNYRGMWFADTDLYKTLEAIGWESGRVGAVVEGEFLNTALGLIERSQDADGYINTHIQGDETKTRWLNLVWSHELYTAGHLFQAAVALVRGAGENRLLEVARRFATRIIEDLGEQADGYDGHAEIETAFVELYRLTGERAYLDFACKQIERRGQGLLPKDNLGTEYFGDHALIRDVQDATGHAVRQVYFATGATDVYLENGERDYLDAVTRIWESAYSEKTYVTGGQGSRHTGEAFGDPFELPPDRAYAETCAGIASFQWNWRMLLATGDSRHAAEMETVLYNTIAASVSLDGCHFFYTNPLQMRTGHRGENDGDPTERLSWFMCACCPPNLARLVASLQNYVATTDASGSLQIHHLFASTIRSESSAGITELAITTNLPWDGHVELAITGAGVREIAVRIPAWAHSTTATLDGAALLVGKDGYVHVIRIGDAAQLLVLELRVEPSIVHAHPRIDSVRGTVALRRGPLVYCIESADYEPGLILEDVRLDVSKGLSEVGTDAPGVRVAIAGNGRIEFPDTELYRESTRPGTEPHDITVTAIPYFAWGNRGAGAMRVWIPTI